MGRIVPVISDARLRSRIGVVGRAARGIAGFSGVTRVYNSLRGMVLQTVTGALTRRDGFKSRLAIVEVAF